MDWKPGDIERRGSEPRMHANDNPDAVHQGTSTAAIIASITAKAVADAVIVLTGEIAKATVLSQENSKSLALQAQTLEFIRADIGSVKNDVQNNRNEYITRDQFSPVRNVVYGVVTLILVSVFGALVALVVLSHK